MGTVNTRSTSAWIATLVLASASSLLGCQEQKANTDAEFAKQIAQGLVAACPVADSGDEDARLRCSANLVDFHLLRDSMNEPFFWGGQPTPGDYDFDTHTNRFNILVWRKMYL